MLLDTDWAGDHHGYSDVESVDVKLNGSKGTDANNLTDCGYMGSLDINGPGVRQ